MIRGFMTPQRASNARGYRIAPVFPGDIVMASNSGSISGAVFYDHDSDGVADNFDGPRFNFKMVLQGEHHDPDTVITDDEGNYSFDNLFADNYTVTELAKNGWTISSPDLGSYNVTMRSRLDTTGLDFGNFYLPDTTRYFTLSQANCKKSPVKENPKAAHRKLPTTGNIIDEAFKSGVIDPHGFLLGLEDTAQPPRFGSILLQSIKQIQFYYRRVPRKHNNKARCFNFREVRPGPKVASNETNDLSSELLPSKVAIYASDASVTPEGFGDLLFQNFDDETNINNGKSVRAIALFADSLLSLGCDDAGNYLPGFDQSMYDQTDSAITLINRSFLGTISTKSVIAASETLRTIPVRVKGRVALKDVPILWRDPNLVPAKHHYVPRAIEEEIPEEYALYQNYPNPFNPTTVISYSLPVNSLVTLKVFNILGQEVATLVNNELVDEGEHEVIFSAEGGSASGGVSSLSSGVYFYRMTASPEVGPSASSGPGPSTGSASSPLASGAERHGASGAHSGTGPSTGSGLMNSGQAFTDVKKFLLVK